MTVWHVPDGLPIILFPGRLTRWKGQDVFLKALAQLPHRKFFAILVGDDSAHPDYKEEVENIIRTSNLEGHARLVGNTPHMAEAYYMSRFVVATSVQPEAFGRVVLEAQAMGKPVIATNHGGACETVREGITGWLVEPGSVDALTKMLDYVLSLDESAMEWMGGQGMENARYFSSADMCAKTLAVYREVLGMG
jgi:glycosyltransferase involved in cell wall biosynthesis